MNQISEKELSALNDLLSGENVRCAIMDCLEKEHSIQQEVFSMMHSKGYYPTPDAEMQKVDEAKQRFSQCYKGI